MLSKHKLYYPVIVGSLALGITSINFGANIFIKEPTAIADNSMHSIPQSSETITTVENLGQTSFIKTIKATVYRDPNCGCCKAWMKHLQENGFQVSDVQQSNMDAVKQKYKVPIKLASCHTAIINGAVIEGHVPADDIKRFLSEKSNAIGLTVPGMVVGSPGMESGETKEPFTVFSFDQQGNTKVFNNYSF